MQKNKMSEGYGPFMEFVAVNGLMISDNWRPSKSVVDYLEKKNYRPREVNGWIRRDFISAMQTKGLRGGDWGVLFMEYVVRVGTPYKNMSRNNEEKAPRKKKRPFRPLPKQQHFSGSARAREEDDKLMMVMDQCLRSAERRERQLEEVTK